MAIVPIREGGSVTLFNNAGSTDLVDVFGWCPLGALTRRIPASHVPDVPSYERLKSRANLDEAHAPALAIEETRFLQHDGLRIGRPTSGPCHTDDIIEALSWLIDHLIGRNSNVHAALATLTQQEHPYLDPYTFTREIGLRRQPYVPNPARFDRRPGYPMYRYRRR